MADLCTSVNFYQNKKLIDTLDQYVVLAFFISMLVTFIVVCLLTQYITYHLILDKEREKRLQQRTFKPQRLEDTLPDSDGSEYDFILSDIEYDIGIGISTNKIEDDMEDISVELETNYLIPNSFEKFKDEESLLKLASVFRSTVMKHYDISDFNIEILVTHYTPCEVVIKTFLEDSKQSVLTVYLNSEFGNIFSKLSSLYPIFSLQTTEIAIDFLGSLHMTSESDLLSVKSNYEKKFDKYSGCKTETFCSDYLSLFYEFSKDVKKITKNNELGRDISSNLAKLPADLLKTFASLIRLIHDNIISQSKSIVQAIKTLEHLIVVVRTRLFYFHSVIYKEISYDKTPQMFNKYEKDVFQVLKQFQLDIQQARTVIKQLHLLASNEERQADLKLEEDINALKLEILNLEDGISFQEKIEKFCEVRSGLLIAHIEQITQLQTLLSQKELDNLKNISKEIKKSTFEKLVVIEETLIDSLKDYYDLSDENILTIVSNIQASTKTALIAYDTFLTEYETIFTENLFQMTDLFCAVVERIIKQISSMYKKYSAVNFEVFQLWPALSEDDIKDLSLFVQNHLSTASFDILHILIQKLLTETSNQSIGVLNLKTVNINEIANDFQQFSYGQKFPKYSDMSIFRPHGPIACHQFLEEFLGKSTPIINDFFEELDKNMKIKITMRIGSCVESVFYENLLLYSHLKKYFQKISKKTLLNYETKTSKYLSRKRSSFKEKTGDAELIDLYQGLLDVKEHRFMEKCQNLELEQHKQSNKETNICMKYLKNELNLFETKMSCEQIQILFSLDKYYMREMFLKKLTEITTKTNHTTDSNHQDRDDADNRSSKAIPQNSKHSSRKPRLLTKKRRSRKIADEATC